MDIRSCIIIAASLFFCVMYLFFSFIGDMGDMTRLSSSGAGSSDAIVVLTGGKRRTDEGLSLLRKTGTGVLILSGVNRESDVNSIFLNKIEKTEHRSIILDKNSRSTYENAVEVRRIMEGRGLKSMVLLTSGYHMKRAFYIFRRVMPGYIRIKTYSVSSPNFDENRWWSGRSLGILAGEFIKYYWYVVRFGITKSHACF